MELSGCGLPNLAGGRPELVGLVQELALLWWRSRFINDRMTKSVLAMSTAP